MEVNKINYKKNGNDEKIVAITVTYNRTKTLKRTIESLLNQTAPLYKIIIVDNNSNKDERSVIKNIAEQSSIIEVIWLNENLGGAGGFEAGMKRTLEAYNPDWYWIMDDDAYPTPKCLENLLTYRDKLDNIGCLAPSIFGIDRQQYQMYHHKVITKYTMKDKNIEESFSNLKEVTQITANAFVGPLFSKSAVESVGIADGGLFIYGDDTEYTYRVSRKFNLYLIKKAIIEHQDPPISNQVTSPSFWWKEYYCNRNRLLFVNKFQKNVFIKIFTLTYLFYILIKQVINSILKSEFKGYKKIRVSLMLKAWKDGFLGKKGKIIDPAEYNQLLKEISYKK